MHTLACADRRNNAWDGFPVLQASSLDKRPTPAAADEDEVGERVSQYGIVSVERRREGSCIRLVRLSVDRDTGKRADRRDLTRAVPPKERS
jgi:hypothetical protein